MREGLILVLFLLAMLWIHRYIFLYADDLYYNRDAQYGLSYLPEAILDELNMNGRAWIGGAMILILKPQIELFRLLNPLILMLVVYILAKMATLSEYSWDVKKGNPSLWIALLCSSLFFLFLPLRIAHTTIYYAACAFNYLYPMALALLYAYLLYTRISSYSKRKKGWLALLGFFVGSSTQQVGMIGIGYTVMISIYLSLFRKKTSLRLFLPFYGTIFLGYGIVTYGSLRRLFWERTAGNDVVLLEVITELLKTNLYSSPAAPFVLFIGLSCIFWLVTFSTQTTYRKPIHNFKLVFHGFLSIGLSLALMGYIYFLLYKEVPIELTQENLFSFYGLSILGFAFLYLFSLVYTSAILLVKKNYPFLLFNSINAIGAQIMLVVVDSRFAAAYKIMFPSLLLLSIFIIYSVFAFRKNTLYLSLAFFMVILSLQERSLALAAGVILLLTLGHYLFTWSQIGESERKGKFLRYSLVALFCLIPLMVFAVTLHGYYLASIPQNYNLRAIKQYHNLGKEGDLLLKKVPPSYYGYNLGNWNSMPYFMKQCYGIKENTPIKYIN
ncbi:hypothetical protein [Desulfitobacterium dichloroeliminans]|nr:hypothetical protein [Desulfitobacterium dichloroeliminans]